LEKKHFENADKQTDILTDTEISIAASRGLPELTQNVTRRPMVTPHLPWKFHANRSSRFLIMLLTK